MGVWKKSKDCVRGSRKLQLEYIKSLKRAGGCLLGYVVIFSTTCGKLLWDGVATIQLVDLGKCW